MNRSSKKTSWLTAHLEGFVKDYLGYVPTLPKGYTRFFTPQEMSVIKNMWRTVKCDSQGKPILLAGRDVFVFEVLARRENYPTTFRSDISRRTVGHIREDYSGYYLFDTGFMGSIPKGLSIDNYMMASASYGVSNRELLKTTSRQVFPRLRGARSLALKIERTPKYWRGAFYRESCTCGNYVPYKTWMSSSRVFCENCGKTPPSDLPDGIGQELNDPEEFLNAAYLTIEVWTDNSPRFSEQVTMSRPKGYYDW